MSARPEKVATPPTAVTGFDAQLKLPPPVAFARVTEDVSPVTVSPLESSTVTTGWVLHVLPKLLLPGEVVTSSWLAAAGERPHWERVISGFTEPVLNSEIRPSAKVAKIYDKLVEKYAACERAALAKI